MRSNSKYDISYDKKGNVWILPQAMEGEFAGPVPAQRLD